MEFEVWKEQVNPNNYSSMGEWAKANKRLIILSPVYLVFRLVAVMLTLMAKLVGITYKEMDIVFGNDTMKVRACICCCSLQSQTYLSSSN